MAKPIFLAINAGKFNAGGGKSVENSYAFLVFTGASTFDEHQTLNLQGGLNRMYDEVACSIPGINDATNSSLASVVPSKQELTHAFPDALVKVVETMPDFTVQYHQLIVHRLAEAKRLVGVLNAVAYGPNP